jgi:hypothetical protein
VRTDGGNSIFREDYITISLFPDATTRSEAGQGDHPDQKGGFFRQPTGAVSHSMVEHKKNIVPPIFFNRQKCLHSFTKRLDILGGVGFLRQWILCLV